MAFQPVSCIKCKVFWWMLEDRIWSKTRKVGTRQLGGNLRPSELMWKNRKNIYRYLSRGPRHNVTWFTSSPVRLSVTGYLTPVTPVLNPNRHYTFQSPTMSGEKIYHANCLCSKVKFTLKGEPFHFVICNCRNCQKASGSAFMANSMFKPEVKFNFIAQKGQSLRSDNFILSKYLLFKVKK